MNTNIALFLNFLNMFPNRVDTLEKVVHLFSSMVSFCSFAVFPLIVFHLLLLLLPNIK